MAESLFWVSFSFFFENIHAITSLRVMTRRARRIPSAFPFWPRGLTTARFGLRNLVTRGKDQSIGKLTYTRVRPMWATESSPRCAKSAPLSSFGAGLRALITLDPAKGGKLERRLAKGAKCSRTTKSTSAYRPWRNTAIFLTISPGYVLINVTRTKDNSGTIQKKYIICTLVLCIELDIGLSMKII